MTTKNRETMKNKEDTDEKAFVFDKVFAEFWPKVLRYIQRLNGNVEAEDLAQEAFMRVAVNLASFRHDAKLSTWIYRIATNVVIDRQRKKQPQYIDKGLFAGEEENLFAGDVDESVYAPASPSETKIIHRDMNRCIRNVVEGLPEKYRVVILLSELEDMKNREIAEILGISLETVKIRLHRGRSLLRDALNERCDFYWDNRNEMACEEKKVL